MEPQRNGFLPKALSLSEGPERRSAMRKWFITLAGAAAMSAFAPATPSSAQGIGIDVPGVGVRIGEPYRHHYYNDWDSPRVYHRPAWREREVYLGSNCRTVTIQRDDGSVKRIRRCD